MLKNNHLLLIYYFSHFSATWLQVVKHWSPRMRFGWVLLQLPSPKSHKKTVKLKSGWRVMELAPGVEVAGQKPWQKLINLLLKKKYVLSKTKIVTARFSILLKIIENINWNLPSSCRTSQRSLLLWIIICQIFRSLKSFNTPFNIGGSFSRMTWLWMSSNVS